MIKLVEHFHGAHTKRAVVKDTVQHVLFNDAVVAIRMTTALERKAFAILATHGARLVLHHF